MMKLNLLEPWMAAYLYLLTGILGAVFGSFITCQADRIAAGESWIKGRSHCDACGHQLSALDLIPIFSYLIHGGKCRYCGTKLSSKYLITEILMCLAFMGILWHACALNIEVVMQWGLTCALLGLSVVDLDKYEIPDGYIIFSIVWWCAGMLAEYLSGMDVWATAVQGLLAGIGIAGSILVLSLIMDKVLKKESMGGGDIKLLFVIGLYLGPLNGLFTLILACVIGLLFVVVLKKDKIPFGPSISLAAYLGMTVLPYLSAWYVGLLK